MIFLMREDSNITEIEFIDDLIKSSYILYKAIVVLKIRLG